MISSILIVFGAQAKSNGEMCRSHMEFSFLTLEDREDAKQFLFNLKDLFMIYVDSDDFEQAKKDVDLADFFKMGFLCPLDKSNSLKMDALIAHHIRGNSEEFTPCHWLKYTLEWVGEKISDTSISKFITESLENNQFFRTGVMRRFVYTTTKNPFKLFEYRNFFSTYGIEVIQIPEATTNYPSVMKQLLKSEKGVSVPLCIFNETTRLTRTHSDLLPPRIDNQACYQSSTLDLYTYNESEDILNTETFQSKILGSLRLDLQSKTEIVFGWDDIFVPNQSDKSYHQLKVLGFKVSPREQNLSKVAQKLIHYAKPRNLKNHPVEIKSVVDFSEKASVSHFVKDHPILSLPDIQNSMIGNMIKRVLNDGVFFRSAINRRQANYWLPGLNAGLPFTRKNDLVHETTYMVHDFFHFTMPDLLPILTGKETEQELSLHKQAYISYRMMSEAITIVMADYIFIDLLKKTKPDYDYTKRKIWPLFDAIYKHQQKLYQQLPQGYVYPQIISQMLKANVYLVLKGDKSLLEKLIPCTPEAQTLLQDYLDKYIPFFIEDYRWTLKNYENMVSVSSTLSKWWDAKEDTLFVPTTGHYLKHFFDPSSVSDMTDQMFLHVKNKHVSPLFLYTDHNTKVDENERLAKAFQRYAFGQSLLMHRFESVIPESQKPTFQLYFNCWTDCVTCALSNDHNFNSRHSVIQQAREVYEKILNLLCEYSLISQDDVCTFKDVYPVFPTFYVSYNQVSPNIQHLKDYAKIAELVTH